MMPAMSFQRQFLDALLSGTKQQTTRKQTDRIKVGDVCHIYIMQRSRIIDKPLRRLTKDGIATMPMERYPFPATNPAMHYAHFLGKVRVTGVDDIRPCEMRGDDLRAWAQADGFKDFHPAVIPPDRLYDGANIWFQQRYGDDWMERMWTVITWNGWMLRYFAPETL
jgi:hypothetical protein